MHRRESRGQAGGQRADLRFERTVQLPDWNPDLYEKIISYWEGRDFQFATRLPHILRAERGSLQGNMSSFDMAKLVTRLTITQIGVGLVRCVLEIDTRWQIVTPYNLRYWELELETFESFMLRSDLRESDWARYERGRRMADLVFGATLGLVRLKPPRR